ncbi:MAG TPA: NfeD family protein, partial [Clostridiales bacterium]|nr:NfeD family protein [Clostridiales bacterium]
DTPTNKDKLPGKTVTVLSEVSKDAGTVRLNDIDFEARLSPEESVPIPVGEKAVVQEIDGIKLIVKAL